MVIIKVIRRFDKHPPVCYKIPILMIKPELSESLQMKVDTAKKMFDLDELAILEGKRSARETADYYVSMGMLGDAEVTNAALLISMAVRPLKETAHMARDIVRVYMDFYDNDNRIRQAIVDYFDDGSHRLPSALFDMPLKEL